MGTALLVSGPPGSGKTTLIRTVLGQLPAQAGGFLTDAIKRRPEVELYRLSVRNRNDLAEAIAARLQTELGLLARVPPESSPIIDLSRESRPISREPRENSP